MVTTLGVAAKYHQICIDKGSLYIPGIIIYVALRYTHTPTQHTFINKYAHCHFHSTSSGRPYLQCLEELLQKPYLLFHFIRIRPI